LAKAVCPKPPPLRVGILSTRRGGGATAGISATPSPSVVEGRHLADPLIVRLRHPFDAYGTWNGAPGASTRLALL
jgi:hypothetical protein